MLSKVTGLKNSNFLVWTGLRQSVPLKLRFHMPDVENIFDLENFKVARSSFQHFYLVLFEGLIKTVKER